MACQCFIIPRDVLERLSRDKSLPLEERKRLADAARFDGQWRRIRALQTPAGALARELLSSGTAVAAKPAVTVYDCATGSSLPGSPVDSPKSAKDKTARRAFAQVTDVAKFFQKVFGRNSVDDLGMTLQSSIHYGAKYNNAFWNGSQMVFGDGDGSLFVDFTKGNDVIGHELTHGVTQFTAQLGYENEAGGLNESISDCFGSMFRQWSADETADQADWLIGSDIMGPAARAKGYTCLRDMAAPAAKHCLAAQPDDYSQYTSGMDPHYSSGIPNLAFCKAAVGIGGNSWEKAGQIWYHALTGYAATPNLKMKAFALRTRNLAKSLYASDATVFAAVDRAWTEVGL